MPLLKRFSDLLAGYANRITTTIENNPDRIADSLDLNYQRMEQALSSAKRELVSVKAQRISVEHDMSHYDEKMEQLDSEIDQAIDIDRDDLARKLLAQKNDIDGKRTTAQQRRDTIAKHEDELTSTIDSLQAQIDRFHDEKNTLKAQMAVQHSRSEVAETVNGVNGTMTSASSAMQRAQKQIQSMSAHADALNEAASQGVFRTSLDDHSGAEHELQQATKHIDPSVDDQLAARKKARQAKAA